MNTKAIGWNLLAVLVAIFVINKCYKSVESYAWVYDSLLKANYKLIAEDKSKYSIDDRKEMKMQFSFSWLKYLRDNTPPDAVILMPPNEIFLASNGVQTFTGEPYCKLWSLNTLYPRRIVYANETELPYYNQITHVAIVNGWGYDYLHYDVEQHVNFAILPINLNQK
ncbi:MAG: hypothetical protein LBR66_07205 [Candidatus Symbiothrix sp.]|jgi:hypothetical protein|nr:hypothetical protein [Candidatus Symbiothrix sp.]